MATGEYWSSKCNATLGRPDIVYSVFQIPYRLSTSIKRITAMQEAVESNGNRIKHASQDRPKSAEQIFPHAASTLSPISERHPTMDTADSPPRHPKTLFSLTHFCSVAKDLSTPSTNYSIRVYPAVHRVNRSTSPLHPICTRFIAKTPTSR